MSKPRYMVHVDCADGNNSETEYYYLDNALHTMADFVGDMEDGSSTVSYVAIYDRAFNNRAVVSFSVYDLGYEVED